MFSKLISRLSGTQLIASGFIVIILTGTILLTLPISSRSGISTDFLTALFTATSATCVTGLVVVDTFSYWSVFGQVVILALIQIGGLGFISLGVTVSIILGRKIGLKQRGLIRESLSVLELGGMVRLTKRVIKGTLFFETVGAILLSIRFIPMLGVPRGIYYAIFHSVSAFCNAGFDLMGRFSPFSSLTSFYDDPLIVLTIVFLIVVGGLGFLVWNDIWNHHFTFRKYSLHTKIVLSATLTLIIGGAILFYLIENGNVYSGMSIQGKILSSIFSSVTPRTAGFNTTDTGALTDGGKLLTIILMFVGGAPGSTAGGIKVTTLFVLLIYLKSTLTRTVGSNAFGRRLDESAIQKAAAVLCTNMLLGLVATLTICSIQGFSAIDSLLEVFSAIGTVGMSAGLTGQLNTASRLIIILLMYLGRVGSLSFAMSLTDKKKIAHVMQPVERIIIG
ncbi:MAG: TrkH family potassium uptake protein [Lachnospiraceae bacterium]